MADTSKSTVVAKLRCFLRAAFRRGWISEALADRVTGHKAVYEQKEPYTDNEVELILAEALRLTEAATRIRVNRQRSGCCWNLCLDTGCAPVTLSSTQHDERCGLKVQGRKEGDSFHLGKHPYWISGSSAHCHCQTVVVRMRRR